MKKWLSIIGCSLICTSLIYPYTSLHMSVHAETSLASKLAGGYATSFVIQDDGSLWSFGLNDNGQLGIGSYINSNEPKNIARSYFNNENVVDVEGGFVNTIALTDQKNAYVWGSGISANPVKRITSFPVRDIETTSGSVGNIHQSIAIVSDTDGSVWSAGSAYYSAFGNGLYGSGAMNNCTTNYNSDLRTGTLTKALVSGTIETCPSAPTLQRIVPGTEIPLLGVKSISADPNQRYVLALTDTGEVYSWGQNYTRFATENPNVSALSVLKIEAGSVPYALTTTGELYYWKGSTGVPVQVNLQGSAEAIIDVVASGNSLLILTESGKLFGLGSNKYGQLGSTIVNGEVPIENNIAKPLGIDHVVNIGAGTDYFLYTATDGNLFGLGKNNYGQLASLQDNSRTTFTEISSLNPIKLINVRDKTSYAIDTSDNLYTWGNNEIDSLLIASGRPGTAATNAPAKVMNFAAQGGAISMKGVQQSYQHGGVVTGNGSFYNWGVVDKNSNGAGGYNGTVLPIKNTNAALSSENFTFIDAYQNYLTGAAINTDGKLFSWGYDGSGALGTGIFNTVNDPTLGVTAAGLSSFQVVAAPNNKVFKEVIGVSYTTYARTVDGEVYSWGASSNGKLGYTSGDNPTPTKISSLPPIQEMFAGNNFALMLDVDGNVWSFGINNYGQLGLGTFTSTSTPTKVPNLPKILHIGGGNITSFAMAENGDVYGWGDNRYGQLGLGDRDTRNSPRLVPITNIKSITGGKEHTMALTNDGKILVTGSDSFGQLGLAQTEGISAPTKVVYLPNLSITTSDGLTYEQNQSFTLNGTVYSKTEDVETTLTYKISGTNFSTTGNIKTYTSVVGYETYSVPIILDASYVLGGYTLTVIATTENGFTVNSSISFGVVDKTAPTITVSKSSNATYQNTPIALTVTSDDIGASGYRGIDYAWSENTARPLTGWSGIKEVKNLPLTLENTGYWYLHLEAYDNAGNKTYRYYGPYAFDSTPPVVTTNVPGGWSQDQLAYTINITDPHSGVNVKKWMPGHITNKAQIISNGADIDFTSKIVNSNQELTFYVEDKLGNGDFTYMNVTSINKTPSVSLDKSKLILPPVQTLMQLSGVATDTDIGDIMTLKTLINSNTYTYSVGSIPAMGELSFTQTIDVSSLAVNTQHTGTLLITDNKEGQSLSKLFTFERYNPNLTYSISAPLNIHLKWDSSTLAESYQVTRNGEKVFESSSATSYTESLQENTTYSYEFWAIADNIAFKVDEFTIDTGHFELSIPSSIHFPNTTLSGITQKVAFTPPSTDLMISNTTQNGSNWKLSAYAEQISSLSDPTIVFPQHSIQLDLQKVITSNFGDINLSTSLFLDQGDYVTLYEVPSNKTSGTYVFPWNTNTFYLWIKPDQKNTSNQDFTTTIHWMISFTP